MSRVLTLFNMMIYSFVKLFSKSIFTFLNSKVILYISVLFSHLYAVGSQLYLSILGQSFELQTTISRFMLSGNIMALVFIDSIRSGHLENISNLMENHQIQCIVQLAHYSTSHILTAIELCVYIYFFLYANLVRVQMFPM